MRPDTSSSSTKSWPRTLGLLGILLGAGGCTTHHWAPIETSQLPPPPGEKVLHTDRIVVHLTDEASETQCVAYERYHPVCFYNIRAALEQGLTRGLWPSFPEVVIGEPKDAGPSDYLLQVEVTLDALPPDDAGPGWSAGARSRFRVLREGKIIAEESLASRSRSQFPYGSPLGEGATEVVDATVLHVAQAVSQIPESRPDEPKPLPRVAARKVDAKKPDKESPAPQKTEPSAPESAQAKSAPEFGGDEGATPAPPPPEAQ